MDLMTKKEGKSKLSLSVMLVLVMLCAISAASAVGMQLTEVTSINAVGNKIGEQVGSVLLNFTINNTGTENINNVTIDLGLNYTYIDGSGTTNIPSNFSTFTTANDLIYVNFTEHWTAGNTTIITINVSVEPGVGEVDNASIQFTAYNSTMDSTLLISTLFGVDNQSPSLIALTSPAETAYSTGGSHSFTYTAVDANLATCSLYTNITGTWMQNETNTTATNSTAHTFTISETTEGVYVWNVRCNDTLMNWGFNETNRTLTIDATEPTVNSVTISDLSTAIIGNTVRSGQTVNISVNITDVGSDTNVTLGNGATLTREATGSDLWYGIVPILGVATISVSGNDSAGNTGSGSLSITLDNTGATTTDHNSSTIDSGTWYAGPVHVGLSAQDTGGANVSTLMYRNGTTGAWTDWTMNLTFSTNIPNNTIQFRANDSVGNVGGVTDKVVQIDEHSPSVAIDSLSGSVVGAGTVLAVTATVTDSLSGLSSVVAYHNGATGTNESSPVTLQLINGLYIGNLTAPTADGAYTVTVNATDNVARYNSSQTVAFSVTAGVPGVSSTVANNSYVGNGTILQFVISNASGVTFNTSDDATPQYSPINTSTVNITVTANSSPTFQVWLFANFSGNANYTNMTYTFTVDNVMPGVGISTPAAAAEINGTQTFTATASDDHSGVSSVQFRAHTTGVDLELKGAVNTSPFTFDLDTTTYSDGNFSLNVTVVDAVGNVNSTLRYFILNNSKPTAATVDSGSVDFSGTLVENIVPTITGLNSTTATVEVRKGTEPFISGGTPGALDQVMRFLNITADTARTATVYVDMLISVVGTANRDSLRVYADHNEDGDFIDEGEGGSAMTYVSTTGAYYRYSFTTNDFSVFAIGLEPAAASSGGGGSGSGGGGGSSSGKTYSVAFKGSASRVGLGRNDKAAFTFNGKQHTVTMKKITKDMVTVTIASTPVTVDLKKGESTEVDLDGDGANDVKVILAYIVGTKKAFIDIQALTSVGSSGSYTAFEIIDVIRGFYAGTETRSAFDIIDIIRAFYGGA